MRPMTIVTAALAVGLAAAVSKADAATFDANDFSLGDQGTQLITSDGILAFGGPAANWIVEDLGASNGARPNRPGGDIILRLANDAPSTFGGAQFAVGTTGAINWSVDLFGAGGVDGSIANPGAIISDLSGSFSIATLGIRDVTVADLVGLNATDQILSIRFTLPVFSGGAPVINNHLLNLTLNPINAVPVPAAFPLMASILAVGAFAIRRRKTA